MDNQAVNPLRRVFLLFLTLFLTSCGFQLNRNQLVLPKEAQSLRLEKVINQSFRPSADLSLTRSIRDAMGAANIPIKRKGDLSFKIIVTFFSNERQRVKIGTTTTYLYSFTFKAKTTLQDLRDNTVIFSEESVTGNYQFETNDDILDDADKDQGIDFALEDLTKNIITKLTQNF